MPIELKISRQKPLLTKSWSPCISASTRISSMICTERLKNSRFDSVKIEVLRTDKILKTKINCQELRADTVRIQYQTMESALTVGELMKKRISRASKSKFSRTSMKEFNSEEP